MLSLVTEQFEKIALRTDPTLAIRLLASIPDPIFQRLQRMRFRHTLKIAAKAPFYVEQFAKRGIDIRKIRQPADLGDFYTSGDDLQKYGAEAFLTGRAETAFETTGTAGSETKSVFFSNRELDEMGRTSALGLYQLGLRREDVIVSAFDVSFWVSPSVLRTALQYLGCFHVEAGKIPPDEFYERARRYRPNVIFGEPSWVARFSEVAAKRGTWPMKFLFAGGENINEATRRQIEEIWDARVFMNYGQTESFGVIGCECSAQQGYNRNELNFYFETVDTKPDGEGELVFTTLTREVMPLIRYRSTDVTRLLDDPCECGLFAKRIAKIKGRVDEMIVCGMGNISPWVFAEMLRGVPQASDEWQVRVWHEDRIDVVELKVETSTPQNGHSPDALGAAVKENLRTRFPDFWKNLEMKLYDLRIKPVTNDSLRTTRKLKRIVALDEPPVDSIPEVHIIKETSRVNGHVNGNGSSLKKAVWKVDQG